MLRDSEIVALRNSPIYKKTTNSGLKGAVADLVRQGHSDLKPEVGAFLKALYGFAKARLVRGELFSCSTALLERFLNRELCWDRKPASVREICLADRNYIWMRYDEPRVDALLSRCKALMGDAEFRSLIKDHSTLEQNKNERLTELLSELVVLHRITRTSIRTRGAFEAVVKLQRDEYYEENEKEIQEKFLGTAYSGTLGQVSPISGDQNKLPPASGDQNNG